MYQSENGPCDIRFNMIHLHSRNALCMDQRQREEGRDTERERCVGVRDSEGWGERERRGGVSVLKRVEETGERAERVNLSTQQLIGAGISVCEH